MADTAAARQQNWEHGTADKSGEANVADENENIQNRSKEEENETVDLRWAAPYCLPGMAGALARQIRASFLTEKRVF